MRIPIHVSWKASKSITKYSSRQTPPRIELTANKDTRDETRTKCWPLVFFIFGGRHVVDLGANRNQLAFELLVKFEFIRCLVVFPNVNEVVQLTMTTHGQVPVSFAHSGVVQRGPGAFQDAPHVALGNSIGLLTVFGG